MFKTMINPVLAGKKILLLILLLISLTIVVFAQEIDREKIMPKKLIYSELPDDYPKELDELFEFYYETVKIVSDYDHIPIDHMDYFYGNKLEEYLRTIPISKMIRIKYLVWLAQNTIPFYYAEYLSINRKSIIENTTKEEIMSLSIIPEKFWEGYLKRISPNTPSPGHIYTLITKSIVSHYPDKLIFIDTHHTGLFIKCKIIDEEFVERKSKGEEHNIFPTHYIKVKVLDSIGKEFQQEEIVLRITHLPDSRKIRHDLIQKEKEYMIPIACILLESPYNDNFTFRGKIVNDYLTFTAPITCIYPLNDGKYHLNYPLYNKYSLGKDSVSYKEFKNVVEAEIDFLKSYKTGGIK